MNNVDYKTAINELRDRCNSGSVSALIGAGFSKNLFPKFPSWSELLYDMVIELYNDEIKTGFRDLQHKGIDKCNIAKYRQYRVKCIIKREGYLNIVSKFIEKKGIREALEVYIEKRIPQINSDGTEIYFDGEHHILNDSDFRVHKMLLKGKWDKIYTTNYDKIIEVTADKSGMFFKTIKQAKDLSISKNSPMIIKLHGDLCDSAYQNSDFCFDGDLHHRYVISKEDYENYPQKHEAFTQLMRLSLLQGTFCLFGFSGDDPNFIAWVKWVRDILNSNKSGITEKEQIKIFLVDTQKDEPSLDKQLFYNNHNIYYIPLFNEDVCNLINAKTDSGIPDVILSFLSHIYGERISYDSLWRSVYKTNDTFPRRIEYIDEEILETIYKYKPQNRIVEHARYQESAIYYLQNNKHITEADAKLAIIAIEDTLFSANICPSTLIEKINSLNLPDDLKFRFNLIVERAITLSVPQSIIECGAQDELIFEALLRSAFTFNFTEVKETIDRWSPKGHYMQKKAALLSMFDREKAKNTLLEYIDLEEEMTELYYATQLLNIIDYNNLNRYSTTKFENAKIRSIQELRRFFIDDLSTIKEEVSPYGEKQKNIYVDGSPVSVNKQSALRFLQLIIECSTMLNWTNRTITEPQYWYRVFRALYDDFPYPTLYFSLQCNKSEILKRIGQDFAYSNKIPTTVLSDILIKLLNSLLCKDTPKYLYDNIFTVAAEMFVSVKPSLWENLFEQIWNTKIVPEYANEIRRCREVRHFVYSGFQHLKSKEIISRIVKECIVNVKLNVDDTIGYLYHLSIKRRNIIIDPDFQNIIDKFVANIDLSEEITVAGNIFYILSEQNKIDVFAKIKEMIGKKPFPPYVVVSASHFTKTKAERKMIKDIVLSHKSLWHNGIVENGFTHPNYMELQSLNKKIKWDKADLEIIFTRLASSIDEMILKKTFTKRDPLFGPKYYDLLDDMLEFILTYKDNLLHIDSFQTTLNNLTDSIAKLRGYVNVDDALISDDGSIVLTGLNQLYREVRRSNIDIFKHSIALIIDRILLKKREGLTYCIYYLSYYMSKHYTKDTFPVAFANKIGVILNIYTHDLLIDLELVVPDNMSRLLTIAGSLGEFGYSYSSSAYWAEVKQLKRFNNT